MNVLVAYDICNKRRLCRVAKIIKDYGQRRQKSIFEVDVDAKLLGEMKQRIEDVIEKEEDSIKYFLLCEKCSARVSIIGLGAPSETVGDYLVL